MAKLLYQGNSLTAVSSDADYLKYDNTTSGLAATNAQGAIDEVTLAAKAINNRITELNSNLTAKTTSTTGTTFSWGGLVTETEYEALDDTTKASGVFFIIE